MHFRRRLLRESQHFLSGLGFDGGDIRPHSVGSLKNRNREGRSYPLISAEIGFC